MIRLWILLTVLGVALVGTADKPQAFDEVTQRHGYHQAFADDTVSEAISYDAVAWPRMLI